MLVFFFLISKISLPLLIWRTDKLCFNLSSANHDCSRQHLSIFFHCLSEKTRLGVSSESSARQSIHFKHQALFSSKDKSKKIKCHLLQFLFGDLRVKGSTVMS